MLQLESSVNPLTSLISGRRGEGWVHLQGALAPKVGGTRSWGATRDRWPVEMRWPFRCLSVKWVVSKISLTTRDMGIFYGDIRYHGVYPIYMVSIIMGVPLNLIIHFERWGLPVHKNHPANWGYPHDYGNPHIILYPSIAPKAWCRWIGWRETGEKWSGSPMFHEKIVEVSPGWSKPLTTRNGGIDGYRLI